MDCSKRQGDVYWHRDHRLERRHDTTGVFLVEFIRTGFVKKKAVGYGRDLSLHGLHFKTPAPLKKGDNLKILIIFPDHFPGKRKILVQGKVHQAYRSTHNSFYHVRCKLTFDNSILEGVVQQFLWWIELSDNSEQKEFSQMFRRAA